jgi:hypothetical protein
MASSKANSKGNPKANPKAKGSRPPPITKGLSSPQANGEAKVAP